VVDTGTAGVVAMAEVVDRTLDLPEPELPDVHPATSTAAKANDETMRSEPTCRASHIARKVPEQRG